MPHQPHHISPLFSAGSKDHGTASVNLTDLIDLASEYAQNHPASVAMLESLLSKCLDFHEARHPSMTPPIRHLANFLVDAMKLSAPNEATSPQVKSSTIWIPNGKDRGSRRLELSMQDEPTIDEHLLRLKECYAATPNMSEGKNPGSMRTDGWTQDEAKRALQRGLMGREEYEMGMSENGLRGTRGPAARKTAYLLSPGIVHELSNGLERMSVNENDFKAVCVAVLSLSQRKLNQKSASLQAVADMTGQGDSSEFSVREIDDEIEILKTSDTPPQPSKKYVAIRLLRTFGFIRRPRLNDKRIYVSKWPESWDIRNVNPALAVDKFWKRHLGLNSALRADGISIKVAKNRFLRGKLTASGYVQHMSDYELAARLASFSSQEFGYTEDGPNISLDRDEQVSALSELMLSGQLGL